MRRSLAPSVQKRNLENGTPSTSVNLNTMNGDGEDPSSSSQTIQTMPMFGFLTIPDTMRKQFVIPSGIRITKANAELRKIKTLGGSRKWRALQPGELSGMRPLSKLSQQEGGYDYDEDNDDLCGLPTGGADGPPFERLILWTDPNWVEQNDDAKKIDDTEEDNHNQENNNEDIDDEVSKKVSKAQPHRIEVIHELARKLRPHQREGVQFLFECTMGLRGFDGEGCILADDMGLGKTLMSIVLLWTLLKQGFKKGESAVRKVVIACPTSLVGNWENEINKWLDGKCTIYAVKTDPKKVIRNFVQERRHAVLIVSYETQRLYQQLFQSKTAPCNSCDLLICDEAHKLKNADSGLTISLKKLPAKKRVLLSGTPMQNELTEFFNMVDFCNPYVLGSKEEFRKKYERPILKAREPDANDKMKEKAIILQNELSTIVNEFILKRGNILNARHLPPKLTQFVCCRLSTIQEKLYDALLGSKTLRHIRDGIQKNALNSILYMQHICAHPQMIVNDYNLKRKEGLSSTSIDGSNSSSNDIEELEELVRIIEENGGIGSKPIGGSSSSSFGFPMRNNRSGLPPPPSLKSNDKVIVDPEQSGKILVLFRMLQTLRAMKEGDRIVIVANTTSVLDIIEELCKTSKYPVLRLDGTTPGPKRTKLVDEFNNQFSNAFVFLLSSKAGGCGINLIGGNRLVLFDPDWNPSSDKQAAGRIWREGQKKKCYIYRFMSTGSIEEKIIQRQLFKQSLQDIVDDRDAVNNIPQNELKNLFVREIETRSDTHDTLSCTRCKSVKLKDKSSKNMKTLNTQQIEECQHFLNDFMDYTKDSIHKMKRSMKSIIPSTTETITFTTNDNDTDISVNDLEALLIGLSKNEFQTLPQFSKKLRNLIWSIQQEIEEVFTILNDPSQATAANKSSILPITADVIMDETDNEQPNCGLINIYEEFLNRWDDCVKMLTTAGRSPSCKRKVDNDHEKDNGDIEIGQDVIDSAEFVPQEGCPEDEDFNKWSHHSTVDTCDDEALRRACQDNDVVSFVFGLEVNWTLLQSKQEEQKEEEEKKKQKAKEDLDALNKRRQMEKENAANIALIKQEKTKELEEGRKERRPDNDNNDNNDDNDDDDFKGVITSEDKDKKQRKLSKDEKERKKRRKEEKKKRSSGMIDTLTALHNTPTAVSATAAAAAAAAADDDDNDGDDNDGDDDVETAMTNRNQIDNIKSLKHGNHKEISKSRDHTSDDDDDDDDFVRTSNTLKKNYQHNNNDNKNKNKRRVIDDDDDDDDNDDDENALDKKMKPSPVHTNKKVSSSSSSSSSLLCGVLSSSKKEKKITPAKEKEIQTEKNFKQLLDHIQVFDLSFLERNYELVDAFEALLMCIGNFTSFEWVKWDENSISQLSTLADRLVDMLETFPGIKPEKKLLIRPAFQSGSFATVRINRFKDFSSSRNSCCSPISLTNNLITIYNEIGRDNLPRTISGAMKSCGYKHRNLVLLSSHDSTVKYDENSNYAQEVTTTHVNGDNSNEHSHHNPSSSQNSVITSCSWNCSHCTYHHEVDCMVCEMCGVKRPRKKRESSSSDLSQEQKQNKDDVINDMMNMNKPFSKSKKPKNGIHNHQL